jgi:hypothetical protein
VQWGGSNPTWNGSHILSEHRKFVSYVGMLRSLRFGLLAIWLLNTSCKDLGMSLIRSDTAKIDFTVNLILAAM